MIIFVFVYLHQRESLQNTNKAGTPSTGKSRAENIKDYTVELVRKCFCSALDNLLREHMYCECKEKTPSNLLPATVPFFNPAVNISGRTFYYSRLTVFKT